MGGVEPQCVDRRQTGNYGFRRNINFYAALPSLGLWMPGDPRSGGKVWEAPDRKIGKPGENRGKVIAHRDLQPSAAFHDRENRRNFRPGQWTADVQLVLSTQSHGHIEFSARLLLADCKCSCKASFFALNGLSLTAQKYVSYIPTRCDVSNKTALDHILSRSPRYPTPRRNLPLARNRQPNFRHMTANHL